MAITATMAEAQNDYYKAMRAGKREGETLPNLDDILKILNISGVMVSSNFAIIITPANKVNEISNIVLRIVNIEV